MQAESTGKKVDGRTLRHDGSKITQQTNSQKRFNDFIIKFNQNDLRICISCKQSKPNKDFYQTISKTHYGGNRFRIRTECKDCIIERQRNKFRENYHHNLEKARIEYRTKHKFKNIKNYYGLTKDQYFKLISENNGTCPICNKKITKPNIDHCHKTGFVRVSLCFRCNLGLGNFDDDIEKLRNAIKYLEKSVSENTLKFANKQEVIC